MSWNVTATGTADEIGKSFDTSREQAAANGMREDELHDIDRARDFAKQFATTYGNVSVSASGHWNGEAFGRVSVTIEKSAAPAPTKGRAVRH